MTAAWLIGVSDVVPGSSANQVDAMLITVIVVLVGVIAMFAKLLSLGKTSVQQTSEINNAVNNVGPGGTRLYDKVANIEEKLGTLIEAQADFTARGWRSLPDDIGNATQLTLTIRHMQNEVQANTQARTTMIRQLDRIEKFMMACPQCDPRT